MLSLSDPEIRVLACLIEKEAAVPDTYPLSLNALRLACNQATNRRPVVAYDDRTVENALLSLKSVGLVRFVHPSHGGRTIRYRHVADERWHLSPGEAQALAALALRGAQTTNDVAARIDRLVRADERGRAEALLDTLAARSPEALARRLERGPSDREPRWVAALGGTDTGVDGSISPVVDWDPAADDEPNWVSGSADDSAEATASAASASASAGADAILSGVSSGHDVAALESRLDQLAERVEQLGAVIGAVAARVERLERELGVGPS